jgi:hypothetical protein
MSKQIKLGFDKNTSRPVSTDQILVDVRGNLLRDSAGEFLFTETTQTPRSFFSERNATSVHVNNESTPIVRQGGSIAIQEVFAETSEVSTSLLGIPRAERQQTLLADVSIYGTDPNTWEFFRNPQPFQPNEWATRTNRTYGRRYNPRLGEHPEEQALALELFPTPWTFPFGPGWEGQGRFNSTLFEQYRRFIQLGNVLYEYYSSPPRNQLVFAQNHFLIPGIASSDGTEIIYNEDFDLAFEYIEQWTMTWMDIRDNKLNDPLVPGRRLTSGTVNSIVASILGFDFSQTQPGYSSTPYRYCQLQSKEAFRYQPGAISGFTFGVKVNSDPATLTNFIEWGAANDTDQLMFQVRGSQFNIVRRSTVPLTRKNLELNGFTLDDQKQIQSPNPFERPDNAETSTDIGLDPIDKPPMFELVIQSDNFNGDPLDGSGPSGYNISFNEVTMYKIEYSWYGAIGAKFYAYIPVGNEETRWVLLHTLVIENTLDEPSLQNPFMHFRYAIYLNDTSSLREPIFLYKYGASYYIDGEDDGTFTYNSYKLPTEKSITSTNSVPLVGFYPKQKILNRDSVGTTNQKNFYIEEISAFSDKNIRLDILECDGCPGGHGHFYATALQNGQRGITDEFIITNTNDLVFADPEKDFDEFTGSKKIIAPGIFSSYVFPKLDNQQSTRIRRRLGSERINTPIDQTGFLSSDVARAFGEDFSPLGYQFTGRLTGFDDIAASTVAMNKSNIKVQFLNPVTTESNGHFAEFRIGITTKKPELVLPEGEFDEVLLFDNDPLDIESEIFGEFAQFQARKNIQGVEVGEWDPRRGITMQQDPRIGRPSGPSSGSCSELNFQILDIPITGVEYSTTDPSGELDGDNFIIFTSQPPIVNLVGGGIGIFDGNQFVNSGLTFTSNLASFFNQATGVNNFVAAISDDISLLVDISQDGVAVKSVRCFGRYINTSRVITFGANEFYLFVAMRDNARINNIVVQEFDETSSFSHTPEWIIGADSNIQTIQVENSSPSASVFDKLTTSNEYIGTDGRFNMGGTTFTGNTPANFREVTRLNSVQFDNQLSLPLRPSSLKTSVYLGANKSETIQMKHVFNIDRYKVTKGTFNNKYLHISSIVTDPGETGTIQINISGREQ